jgi:hypothetical protein
MTAMERIKDLLDECPCHDGHCTGQRFFLLKAFRVMREIAIRYSDQSWHRGDETEIDAEFEEKMKA